MNKLLTLLLIPIIYLTACQQKKDKQFLASSGQDKLKGADKILLNDIQPVKMMFTGTWHFDYPGLDSHQTDEKDKVDIESAKRQNEVLETVNYLARFAPTMICVEVKAVHQSYIDSLYQEYLKGSYTLSKSEVTQIGFRLAKRLGHQRVYAVDSRSYYREHSNDSNLKNIWEYEIIGDSARKAQLNENYQTWYASSDKLLQEFTILERIQYENDTEVIKRKGSDMLQRIHTNNQNGADILALRWYNRNLRIANHIVNLSPTEDDRILVLFGSSHIPVLKHFFDYLPQYKTVDFKELAKKDELI